MSEIVTKKMSAAAFFNDNRAIAGFGNSMRAVFTSIRELVENGLDAAERRGTNPVIGIDLRRLSQKEIQELLDVRQYRALEKHLDFLQLTCIDNGIGVPGHLIADLFGRVLTGTKYGVIQTRGRFGLGAKMCLLYSMSSVDLPARIRSRHFMDNMTHELHLMINLEKNEPIIMEEHEYLPGDPNYLEEPGTEISITFTGAWNLAKNSVKEYFKQLAIITPYASLNINLPGDKDDEIETLTLASVVDDMPPQPEIVKIHPWGCDITQFKSELSVTQSKTLKEFLANHFMGVTEDISKDFFQLLGIDPSKEPKEITSSEIRRVVHEGFVKAYQEAREIKRKRDRKFQFDPPRGNALSPLGSGRLKKGIEKELQPQFIEAITRPPKAYSGHPFIIEAALGYGGGVRGSSHSRASSTDNKIIYRYANRIPLIFGAGNDVITKVVSSIKWSDYGLTKQSDPLAIAVSLVSTKIPFPETSKEYISNVPEIEEDIRLALMQLGRRLKTFLSRAKRRRREHARLSRFVKSAPVVIENLSQILQSKKTIFANFLQENDRIASALAHGAPKKAKLFMPLGKNLFSVNVWCPSSIKRLLNSNNIVTLADFFNTQTDQLATTLDLTEDQVNEIKEKTINEFDRENISPLLDNTLLISRNTERRFSKKADRSFVSLKDALYRRWIQNSYHFLATEVDKLRFVSNLLEKLFEYKKELLITHFKSIKKKQKTAGTPTPTTKVESLTTYTKLKVEHLFPSFEQLKAMLGESCDADLLYEEFIFQIIEPTGINYQAAITKVLVENIQQKFKKLIDKFPNFSKIQITKMKPDWTDGYTKNAFHRRKISTIGDFVKKDSEDLILIKELERILFSRFLDFLIKNTDSMKLSKLPISNLKELQDDVKATLNELANNNINTLAELVKLQSHEIEEDSYYLFASLLLKEAKTIILNHLNETQQSHDISHLKIIPHRIEMGLKKNQIFSTSSFLAHSFVKLKKMGFKKKDINDIKKQLGTQIPSWLKSKDMLKTLGITILEELFYNTTSEFTLSKDEKKQYEETITILRKPLIFGLPELRNYSNLLNKVGINCIGRFLLWPVSELMEILNLNKEEIQVLKDKLSPKTIKQNADKYGKNLSSLVRFFPKLVKYFETYNLTIQDLFYIYISEKRSLNSGYWKKINQLNEFSQADIPELTNLIVLKSKKKTDFQEALLKLKMRNIRTIKQFLNSHPNVIETELTVASERKIALEILYKMQNGEIEGSDAFQKQMLLVCEFDAFQHCLNFPISRISNFTLNDYDKLRNKGIIGIHQLFEYTEKELSIILEKPVNQIEALLGSFNFEKERLPFYEKAERGKYKSLISFDYEDSERFSSEEIDSLIHSGYDSVDQLFYLTHHSTFSSPIVNWKVMDRFKKLLRSPLTLVSWEKKTQKTVIDEETQEEKQIIDVQYSSLTTQQLNTLRSNNLTRIIDLLLCKTEKLQEILKIEEEEAKKLQKNVRIIDSGLDLSELGIFKPQIERMLEEKDIVTIEDLYFSTSKANWNIPKIPWGLIDSIKKVLNIQLSHLSDMLDPELIKQLGEANVKSLLGFMLSTPEEIMEKTGIADERFENIKSGLDLGYIIQYFSLPVYFVPELSFYQTELLRQNDIKTVIDFVVTHPRKLSTLLKMTEKKVRVLASSLSVQVLAEEYEEKGVFASETKLFDRSEQRLLSKDSILQFEGLQTIQEMYYLVSSEYYQLNQELWSKISALKKVLSLPLRIFTDISDYSLSLLEKVNIRDIFQILFIPDSDLEDPVLYRTVSIYSSSIIDLRAFHYFAMLPATVYNSSFFSKIVKNIQDMSLVDIITNEKVIEHLVTKDRQYIKEHYNITFIRSLLELPLRISPLYIKIPANRRENYKDMKVGQLLELSLTENPAIAPVLKSIKEIDSFNEVIQKLSLPIATMGLPRSLAIKLSKSSVFTLIDFYSSPTKQLSEMSGHSQKLIREIKENLAYSDIIKYHSSHAHPIIASSFISEEQIEKLKKHGISDLETLYYSADVLGISSLLPVEYYKKSKEILSGSIRFLGFLSFDEIKKLESMNIHSIIDLALLSKKELKVITGNEIYTEFHILDLIAFDEIAEKRLQTAIPLISCSSIKEDYLDKLNEIGIHSVQDFISRISEIVESHPYLVVSEVFREIKLYLSSVAFVGLPIDQTNMLIYLGIEDILTYITEDPSTIAIILHTDKSKIISSIKKLSPKQIASKVKLNGVKLIDFLPLSKGRVANLVKSEKELVQDLYSLYYQPSSIPLVSEGNIENFIELCNASVYRIKELSLKEKIELRKHRIYRVIDLLSSHSNVLRKIFGKIPESIKKIKTGEFSLSNGIPLNLNKPMLEILAEVGFDSPKKVVEDLFSYVPELLYQYSDEDRIEKTKNVSFLEQLVSFLCLNVLTIPNFDPEAKMALWRNGIRHIIDVLVVNVNSLTNVPKNIQQQIRFYQREFDLSRNMSATFSPFINQTINLPDNVKEKFAGYGINNILFLMDFIPHPVFDFSNEELAILSKVSENIVKPITWLYGQLKLNIDSLMAFLSQKGTDILSAFLLISQQDIQTVDNVFSEDLQNKLYQAINKEILDLKVPNWAIRIDQTNMFVKPEMVKKLKKKGIEFLDEFLALDSIAETSKTIDLDNINLLNLLHNIPISVIKEISAENVTILTGKGINTTYDFLYVPTPILSKLLKKSIEKINEIKSSFKPSTLINKMKLLGLDINTIPTLQESTKKTLVNYGFASILQIKDMQLDKLRIPQEEVKQLTSAITELYTPITLLGKELKIKKDVITNLVSREVFTYDDLVKLPLQKWLKEFKVIHTKQKAESSYLLKLLKSSKKKGMLITELNLSKRLSLALNEIGIITIDQLLFVPSKFIISNTKISKEEIETIREKLDCYLSYIPNISRETIEFCYQKGYTKVSDVLIYFDKLPKDVKEDILKSVSHIKNIEELHFKEPLSPTELYLQKKGFKSYKSVLSSLELKKDKELSNRIVPILTANIRFLNIDKSIEDKLKRARITTISDLLILSPKTLSSKSKIKQALLNNIIESIKIDKVESEIAHQSGRHLVKAFSLPNKDKNTLKSYGIYNLSDFKNNTSFSWLIPEKEIKAIRVKIASSLETPLLFYTNIAKMSLLDIEDAYFSKGIFNIQDLLSISQDKEVKEIESFLTKFATNKKHLIQQYLPVTEFLAPLSIKNLFTNDTQKMNIKNIIDLSTSLYYNKEQSTEEGKEIIAVLECPISILDVFSNSDIEKLAEKGVKILADFLLKPKNLLMAIIPQKLAKHVSKITEMMNYESLKKQRDKATQIASMKLFDPEIKKTITQFYTTINELVFAIKNKVSFAPKPVVRKIENLLNTPIQQVKIPGISLNSWLKLIDTIDNLADLYVLSNKELTSILSIVKTKAAKTIVDINVNSIVKVPILRENLLFGASDVAILKEKQVTNYSHLYKKDLTNLAISSILKSKIEILLNLRLSAINSNIKESFTLITLNFLGPIIDTLAIEKEKQITFSSYHKMLFSKGHYLINLIQTKISEDEKLLANLTLEFLLLAEIYKKKIFNDAIHSLQPPSRSNLNRFLKLIERSPVVLVGPGLDAIGAVADIPVTTINELLLMSEVELKALPNYRLFNQNLKNLSLPLLEEQNRRLIKFPKGVLQKDDKAVLDKKFIFTVEDSLVFNKKFKSKKTDLWKITERIKNIMMVSLYSLTPIVQSKTLLDLLTSYKIDSLYELLIASQQEPLDEKQDIIQMLNQLEFSKITQYMKEEEQRFSNFIADEELKNALLGQGISSLGSLISMSQGILSEEHPLELEHVLPALRAPLSLIIGNNVILNKLRKIGLVQVADLVLPPNIKQNLEGTLSEKEIDIIQEINNKMNLQTINSYLKTIYPLSNTNFIDSNIKQTLMKAGYSSIKHLEVSEITIIKQTKLRESHIVKIKKLLNTPIYILSEMLREDVQSVRKLHKKEKFTLFQVMETNINELSTLTKLPSRQIKVYLSSLSAESIRQSQKDQVSVSSINPHLTKEDVKALTKANITSLQQLILPTASIKRKSAFKLQNVEKLRHHLEKPIEEIELHSDDVSQLKQLGVLSFGDFVLYPTSLLEGKINQNYLAIKRLKARMPLKGRKPTPSKKKVTPKKKTTPTKKPAPKTKVTSKKKITPTKKPAPKTKVTPKKKTTPTKKPTPKTKATPSKKPTPIAKKVLKSQKSSPSKSTKPKRTRQVTLLEIEPASKSGTQKSNPKKSSSKTKTSSSKKGGS